MWFHSLLASWKSGVSRSRRPQPRPARRGMRLVLEQLEDRSLPSNYSAASVSALIADINAANKAGGANTIDLSAPTTSPYVLTAANNATPQAGQESPNGLPVIAANDNLTIVGNGDTIERSAATFFRLFDVAIGSLTLENLMLQGGYVRSTSASAYGGAIYNYQGTLVLNGVTVQGNLAENFDESAAVATAGGGIFSYYGSVTLERGTIIQNNEAEGNQAGGSAYGGGLAAIGGTVSVTNATLNNNTARAGGEGAISGSYSAACGGGLYISGGTLDLTNATLDGNAATQNAGGGINGTGGACGGGLFVDGGAATLTSCTVQANSASVGNSIPSPGQGGGIFIGYLEEGAPDIYFEIGGATVSLDAATVAQATGNIASSGAAYDNIVGPYTLS